MDNFPLLSLCFSFLVFVHSVVDGKLISSCSQTPYPEICNSFISKTHQPLGIEEDRKFNFRDFSFQATMKQAQQAHQLASAVDVSSFDVKAKSAWADCLELVEDTLDQLNRSMTSSSQTNMEDAQTWLSAAIYNQETCQNGFIELNSSSHLAGIPFMFNNVSKLIGNSLAVNRAALTNTITGTGNRRLLSTRFPTWVSVSDRKLLQSKSITTDIVVAKDGSGHYRTITEAVAAAAKHKSRTTRLVIHVKAGVYKENIEIKKSMKNLMFIGDGVDATIVTGNRNVIDGSTTFRSATFAVSGDGFIAKDMTFENTAGPQKHQAVALRSDSDFSIFYRCSFRGYQDTLYAHSLRQFYRNCDIYGTVDFIFGDAVAVFQNCAIYVRRPMPGQTNTVTAQGRTDPNENTGISIQNSRITAASDLIPVQNSVPTYLGRPWKQYSRTVIMKSYLDSLINKAGWLEWKGNFALDTLYYGEYMNIGAGAGTSGRVNWPGYHAITSAAEAGQFTVKNFLGGSTWLSATGVPYTLGL